MKRSQTHSQSPQPVLLIHGGAWAMPDDAVAPHERGIAAALAAGWSALTRGGTAIDAVEAAVTLMEDDDTFDAGRGSFLTRDGRVQLDALLMNGADLRAGGVACVERLRNPIQAARLVLERSPHVYFVGSGAERFATQHGMRLIDNTELIVPRERDRLMAFQRAESAGHPDTTFSGSSPSTSEPIPPVEPPPKSVLSTGAPHTPVLSTEAPHTPVLSTGAPHTPVLSTEAPHTPVLSTEAPYTPVLSTEAPYTPVLSTEAPYTPVLSTEAPYTPVLSTEAPYTPVLSTGAPYTPVLSTGAPYTPVISTGAPYTPVLSTGAPYTPVISTEAQRSGETPVFTNAGGVTEAEVSRTLPDELRIEDPTLHSHDTVGAVALDPYGNLAAGTSTGGTLNKAPGRVGDSSLIGCGCYADNLSAAVSLTGWGEPIMKLVLGKWAVDRVASGATPQAAATEAIAYLYNRLGGHGGIILLGPDGQIGIAHNTPRMAWGIATAEGRQLGITRNP